MTQEKTWFFTQYLGDDEMRGEISINGYDREELEDKYGVRKIAVGMILKQVADPDEPRERVIAVIEDGHLAYQLDALAAFDDAFGNENKPILTFLQILLSTVHDLYVREGVH